MVQWLKDEDGRSWCWSCWSCWSWKMVERWGNWFFLYVEQICGEIDDFMVENQFINLLFQTSLFVSEDRNKQISIRKSPMAVGSINLILVCFYNHCGYCMLLLCFWSSSGRLTWILCSDHSGTTNPIWRITSHRTRHPIFHKDWAYWALWRMKDDHDDDCFEDETCQ